jgi:hypothetical protein
MFAATENNGIMLQLYSLAVDAVAILYIVGGYRYIIYENDENASIV